MDDILRKIDLIIDRTGVSYASAKEALEQSGGSVIDAIIYLENKLHTTAGSYHQLKGILKKAKETKIRVLKEGEQVAEVPMTAGILGLVGTIALPGLAAIGAIGSAAALLSNYSLEVKKSDTMDDQQEENLN
ncbi:DUF4342 domain-containing protein [Dehalobacterium formicoaceticum]|uniref:DUF4342 domain-containing protein n=1 Tax=Dehalobacterium formicoaceticum TaxID=51515 RepID=A0ABT1XZJ9_9FIRM|nr:DUF4342 domain-containing protein [Dehalobacterium formicoaceticum]MCR6544038.1 DUF4342 domain-containing protein [Dehalobacterium formicoaceticum]